MQCVRQIIRDSQTARETPTEEKALGVRREMSVSLLSLLFSDVRLVILYSTLLWIWSITRKLSAIGPMMMMAMKRRRKRMMMMKVISIMTIISVSLIDSRLSNMEGDCVGGLLQV